MKLRNFKWFALASVFCLGFRVFPGNQWALTATPASGTKLFVIYPNASRSVNNDLPSGDVLAGTGSTTVQALMNSIFNDFNSIQGAYVTLVDSSDSDYTTQATNRTITIEEQTPGGTSAGEAKQETSGDRVIACKINLKSNLYDSAKQFVATVTHELGHCLGLDHPQELTASIMSYFHDESLVRLQTDDKMGILMLYPVDAGKAKEAATLGMACARKSSP